MAVVTYIAWWALFTQVLEVAFDLEALADNPDPDEISFSRSNLGLFVVGAAVTTFVSIINVLRRLKDLHMGSIWALLSFIPVIGFVFSWYLVFALSLIHI